MHTRDIQSEPLVIRLLALLLLSPVLLTLHGCTDLEPNVFGQLTPEEFFQTEREVLAAMAPVYAQLRSTMWGYHNITQISSDETVVPTRGDDWFDGGKWLDLHRHTFAPASPSAFEEVNQTWNDSFTGIARANVVLANVENSDLPNAPAVAAELRALRAFFYYTLLDAFGNVPIVTVPVVDADNPPANVPRAEVFDFIETELLEAREFLPETWGPSGYGRITTGSVDAILASMYLNAEVWTGDVTTSGLTRGTARWNDAIAAVDRILNSGLYTLQANWRDNFAPDNHLNPEALFVVAHLPQWGGEFTFQMRALHYNQLPSSPWNGFSTIAETYNRFEEDDPRREIFLEGEAFHQLTGEPVENRQGNPLIFTPEIGDVTQASENEGVRILKWPVDPNAEENAAHGNDYAYFRLAEMHLIKAEALNELGRTAEAIDEVNIVRARVYGDAHVPLEAADFNQQTLRDRILDERLFELTMEARRRQDLIRHEKFNDPWFAKAQSPAHKILFPIPEVQMDANPNLTQNPGY